MFNFDEGKDILIKAVEKRRRTVGLRQEEGVLQRGKVGLGAVEESALRGQQQGDLLLVPQLQEFVQLVMDCRIGL